MSRRHVLVLSTVALYAIVGCTNDEAVYSGADSLYAPGQAGAYAGTTGTGYPQTPCLQHEQQCDGGCFDLNSSLLHCGACNNACAPGEVCEAGICRNPCGPDLGFCAGQCIDLTSNPSHCGVCNNVCPAGQVCVDGACSTFCNGTICPTAEGSVCVTLSEDRNHCGACNNACAEGYICVAAQCVLDCGTLTECNGVCVDLQSDNANCGSCGIACPADMTCTNGVCTCLEGLELCGDVCVDLQSDNANCGSCGVACPVNMACTNGACTCLEGLELCGDACVDTTVDTENCGTCGVVCVDSCEAGSCVGPDGCTDTQVVGLSLSELAVYQAVKISVMQNLTAIGSGQRNADVVQGRPSVFRVHVTPGAGWTPREVSARIELTNAAIPDPGNRELFFSLLTPTGASSDEVFTSTFNIEVPAEALTADTRYAVTLVECAVDPPVGTAQGARFPSDGFTDLQARKTGPLRVHLIPLQIPTAAAPDLPDSTIEVYRSRVFAMYPITEVEFTVGAPLVSNASSMCSHLSAIAARRSADNAPVDLYYYGLTSDISGGQSGCSNAISNPSSASKASVGWAAGYASRPNPTEGAATMCHELGHAHGRLHSPCGVSDPDWNYPYPNADIGVWGHDMRKGKDVFLSPTLKDMMSYCPNPDRSLAWISDYTYQGILERVAAVNALVGPAFFYQTTESKVPWRLLVVDHLGSHWGEYPLLVSGTPEGVAMTAIVYDHNGTAHEIEVYKQDLVDGVSQNPYMLTIPEPDPSWYAIEVPGLLAPQVF